MFFPVSFDVVNSKLSRCQGLVPVSRSGPLPDRNLYLGSGGAKLDLDLTILTRARGGEGRLSRAERELFLGQSDPSRGER